MAKVPIRNRGDDQCPYHDGEVVVLSCINCDGELVCAKCIPTRHKHHEFENISKLADEKKTMIQEFVQKVQETKLPTIKYNLKAISNKIKESAKYFEHLKKEIILQGEKMKAKVDKITNKLIHKCSEIEKQNCELLSKYTLDLTSLYTQLKEIIDECKDTLKTDNSILTVDTEKDIQQDFTLPKLPTYKLVEFTALPMSSKHLLEKFGSLFVEEVQMLVLQKSHHTPKSDVVKQYRFNDSTVESAFTYFTDITSVEKSTSDSVWLSCQLNECILHVTLQGKVKQKLKLGSDVNDISVSPVTGNLWLCCSDNAVYEASGNKPTKRFTTDSLPWCLCMTPDNNVVVGTDGNITVYSIAGQALHSTQESGSVVTPHHVTVCTNTGDIVVCDDDLPIYGGKGKQHVSMFNSKLYLKCQYYGPASVMKSDFYPRDVVYDTQGHLLIADNNNKCIQLISGEGQFLTVVHIDTLQPKALTLIQDGLLYVGFENKKIKLIRYKV